MRAGNRVANDAMAETSNETLDKLIDAAAEVLALPIEPEWKLAVKAHLGVTLRLAASVAELELADEAEPAPTFEA